MTIKANFDHIAKEYDTDFTFSEIGKKQRTSVYHFLGNLKIKQKSILELNCGTGEDALWLAHKENRILATDISSEMLGFAKQKAKGIVNIKFQLLDINNLNVISNQKNLENKSQKFDLIFSNFGGLNCLSKPQLKIFFKNASKLLTENGKIICVIMPKNCVWENTYLFITGKWKQLFRRNTSESIDVKVGNSIVKTWYYNPKEITELTISKYSIESFKPIGFFIPPSYLESFFKNKIGLLNILNWMEKRVKYLSFLSRYSDHYIISLQLK